MLRQSANWTWTLYSLAAQEHVSFQTPALTRPMMPFVLKSASDNLRSGIYVVNNINTTFSMKGWSNGHEVEWVVH